MARPRSFDENSILETAMAEYWRCSFETVTFRELSKITGLGLRSLTNTFGDKETFYIRVLEHYVSRMEENLPRLLSTGGAYALVSLFAQISAEHPADAPRQNGCLIVNQISEIHRHDNRLQTVIDRYFACLDTNFNTALAASGIISEVDDKVKLLITMLVGMQLVIRLNRNTCAAAGIDAHVTGLIDGWIKLDEQL